MNNVGGIILGLAVGFFIILVISSCAIIEDGQTGVRKVFGHINDDPVGTGITLDFPIIYSLDKWNTKTREMKESASVPSSEGLISTLEVSLIYRVSPKNAPIIRKNWGREDVFAESILEPYFREAIRLVVSGYPVKALYSEEGRNKIGKEMKDHLTEKVGEKLELYDVLLRDVGLPKTFSDSIEKKLKAEQEALQQEFELQKASKKAEIAIAEAKGVAAANNIIAGSITDNYLKYCWINNMKGSEFQVIYVPTETGLPILEAGKRPNPFKPTDVKLESGK